MPQVNDFCWSIIMFRSLFALSFFVILFHYSSLFSLSSKNFFKNLVFIII